MRAKELIFLGVDTKFTYVSFMMGANLKPLWLLRVALGWRGHKRDNVGAN